MATLVLMNEFDYIIQEAREIFDFYGMNREKPVIDEILYNSDYALRHLLGDKKIFDENLKKEVPILDILQQFSIMLINTILGLLRGIKKVMMNTNLGTLRFPWIICFMLCLQNPMMKTPLRKLRRRRMTKLRSLLYA